MKILKNILACPICKSSLTFFEGRITCINCKNEYYIREDIPILLPNINIDDWTKNQEKFFDNLSKIKDKKISKISKIDNFFDKNSDNDNRQHISSWIKYLNYNSLVLDCCCGDGNYTSIIASGRKDIVMIGMDISFENIKKARDRIIKSNLENKVFFIVADINLLPFQKNSFDAICILNSLHHILDQKRIIYNLSRCLVIDGYMLNVEIISNNPINNISRLLFLMMPRYVKNSMGNDLIVDGDMPDTNIIKGELIRNYLFYAGMQIISIENRKLFLFVLDYFAKVLPFLNYVIPYFFLTYMLRIEKRIISVNFFRKFCMSIMYISKRVE